MNRVIQNPNQSVPLRIWARDCSNETIKQGMSLASQSFVVEAVCLMADAHVANGVAVGSVFATESALVPAALGSDLGCGMTAIRLAIQHNEIDQNQLDQFVRLARLAVPVNYHARTSAHVPLPINADCLSTKSLSHHCNAMLLKQLGTLGSGNHFLELDADPNGFLWLLVHSGSRGMGGIIGEHYKKAAKIRNNDTIASIDEDSCLGREFLNDLNWALFVAAENRKAIVAKALSVIEEIVEQVVQVDLPIDTFHNCISKETWCGKSLFIHRKGAVAARSDRLVLIPGSMGSASYLAQGLQNEVSFGSCSHGAGRVLRRKDAISQIHPRDLERQMRKVSWPKDLAAKLVEEAPSAYRDIKTVMDDQADLVQRVCRLEPLAVVKG